MRGKREKKREKRKERKEKEKKSVSQGGARWDVIFIGGKVSIGGKVDFYVFHD